MPTQPHVEAMAPVGDQIDAQLLALFFDRTPMGIGVFGTDMRLQRCNKTWVGFYEHYLGVPPAYTAPGRHIFELIPGNEESVQELFDHALAGEVVRQAAHRIDIPGRATYWDVLFAPLFADGKVVGVVDIITDATDRVTSTQLLEARIETFSQIATGMSVDQPLAATLAEVVAAVRQTTGALACSVISWEEDTSRPATAYADPILGEGFAACLEEIWVRRGFERLEPVPEYDVTIRRDFATQATADPALEPLFPFLPDRIWHDVSIIPLVVSGVQVGEVVVYLAAGQDLTADERAYLRSLADQTAVAVRNSTMFRTAEQNATLVERHRLARDLHDSVSQALFSMTLHVRTAQRHLEAAGLAADHPVAVEVDQLQGLTQAALAEMRALIFELRPGALEEEGLAQALVKQATALTAREQIPIHVDAPPQRVVIPAAVEEHLYRIALEALHNAIKHAGAMRIDVTLETTVDGALRVTVLDDGRGFDLGVAHPGHLGLGTMRDRAQSIGARLEVTSAPGQGTLVTVDLQLTDRT
ncbi:MAG: PAS domain-containing protein [Nocardioidaceae bacterium]|nr:PAS domain-containing protein [Nocardioidaceae bacterium]